jgi:type IV pilus assembly protein PilY1
MARYVVRATIAFLFLSIGTNTAWAVSANPDKFGGFEDGAPVTGNILLNDVSDSGAPLEVLEHDAPGEVTLDSAGNFTLTLPPHVAGDYSFSYTVVERDVGCLGPNPSGGCTDKESVQLQVAAVADAPVLNTGGVSGAEDTAIPLNIGLILVDTDGSQSLTATVSGLPTGATLSAGSDLGGGVWAVPVAALPGLTVTPPLNLNGGGPLTVEVNVTDQAVDAGGDVINTDTTSVSGVVNVTVDAVNDPPYVAGAIPDLNFTEDTTGTVDLSGVFDDVDIATNGDALVLEVTSISHAGIDTADMGGGTTLTVTPLLNQVGDGTVEVTAKDADGATETVTISVSILEANDPPVVVGSLTPVEVDEDAPNTVIDLSGLFDDPDIATSGDSLTLSVPGAPGSLFDAVSVTGTTLSLDYAAEQNGATTLTITATDTGVPALSESYTLNVTVNAVNDPPYVAGAIPFITTNEDVDTSADLSGLFDDVDIATNADALALTVTNISHPAIDTATMTGNLLNITLLPNQLGDGTLEITAADQGTPPLTESVTINVSVVEVDDGPFVVGSIAPVAVDEDAPNTVIDVSTLFDDADIVPSGDVLTLDVSDTSNPALFASASITGTDLVLDYAENQNGMSTVTITATDTSMLTADYVATVNVNAVNDEPFVAASLADVTMDEDDPPFIITIEAFDDVDIATNADSLAYIIADNTNPDIFNVAEVSGDTLTLELLPDANGTAEITIRATDIAGAAVEDTFLLNAVSVNDIPDAVDDTLVLDEDTAELVIPVLDNDYLAEQPTVISLISPNGEHTVLDAFDDPVVQQNAVVTVSADGSSIIYRLTQDFFGTDTFTYTITDAEGDSDTATVSVTVNAVNDPPVGVQLREYDMLENQTLTVDAASGVLRGAYDVEARRVDESGAVVGGVLVAQIETLPGMGVLSFDSASGAFTYTPPTNTTGRVEFTYRLFDNNVLSEDPVYVVRIDIDELPPPPEAPEPGQVATFFNLSQVPLEQSATVPPNVMVVMDDSGSMDWNVIVDTLDENGLFLLSNADIAGRRADEVGYAYLWDLDSNAYPPNSEWGAILPTEEALKADPNHTTNANTFGVWRARTAVFNRVYYDPTVHYEPWIGQDEDNNVFVDADPRAVRLDPVDPDDTFPLLEPHSYKAAGVPVWDNRGGTSSVDVVDLYIPFYYATSLENPRESDTWDEKIVITADNAPFPGGPDRDDCRDDGNPLECSYEQEIQNFANWFQYYRSREYVTKGSMGSVIAEVQDIRVGYETISATTSEDVAEMNDLYSQGEKKELLDNVYAVDSYGGTPLRQALDRASKILGCQVGSDCPALPEPEGQCQQNFVLLFTDGYWNGGAGVSANTDINGDGDFDGGRYADDVRATLADTAMEYYENDLFPGVDDGVPIGIRDIQGAPEGTFDGVDAMHQHIKTYAIAFGVTGTIEPSEPQNTPVGNAYGWTDPFDGSLEKIDDLVHAALNGRGDFLSAGNPAELQAAFESAFLEFTQAASSASAAAFNSTSLRDGTLLYRGFYDLRTRTGELTATEVDNAGILSAEPSWYASEKLDPGNIQPANRVLVTYNPLLERGVEFVHSKLAPVQQITMTEAQVDFMRGDRSNEQPTGELREREPSGALLGPIVNSSPVFVGAPRAINRDQSPFPTDDLYSTFTDSVKDRLPVVYVGSNDGMLHGFNAATGLEVFGFVPNKILDSSVGYSNKLNEFSSPFYYHNYYVDLSPRLNDVYMRPRASGAKQWMTTLVGGLGAGGKGFFALNVNDPDTMFASDSAAVDAVLWEFTDDDDTYPVDDAGLPLGGSVGAITDPNGDPVKDLGYAVSAPLVQMTNFQDGGTPARNEWAAIFGNGANSTSGIAKLFVLFMDRGLDGWDDAGDFVKISTGFGVPLTGEQLEGYPNALGSPTSIDADLDGTVDYVYAGDRIGNLFRFDLTSDDPDDWHAVRLFTATYNDGVQDVVQPITQRPLVVKNPDGIGFIVIFGTGSLLTSDDSGSTEIQSIYGIWDRLTSNPATAADDTKSTRLVEQTITNVVDDTVSPAQTRRVVSRNAVEYVADGADPGTYGWYIDLDMPRATTTLTGGVNPDITGNAPPDAQFPGEKAVRRLVFRNGAVITTTVLPASDETSCFGARPGSILVFDAFNGGDAIKPVIDFNTDGVVSESDLVDIDGESYSAGLLFNQDDLDGSLVDLSTLGGEGDTDFLFVSGGNDTVSYRIVGIQADRTGRLSWVELDDAD